MGWTQFRGDFRNGQATGIPKRKLKLEQLWEFPLPSEGVGGIAASEDLVVVTSRDANDQSDVVFVLNPNDGGLIFRHDYKAIGRLDYGNSPRATPVIGAELIFTLGAFGHLVAIDPAEGRVRWQYHFETEFGGKRPTWGFCSSPMLVDGLLIVQPGGHDASIVALDANSGVVRWKTPREQMVGYASPIVTQSKSFAGSEPSIINCDEKGLFACALNDGAVQWEIKPKVAGEFMVPSPILLDDTLYWNGESNGLRGFHTDQENPSKAPMLVTQNLDVASDTHSPTALAGHVVTVDQDLVVLDPKNGLQMMDRFQHESLDGYAAIMTQQDRALIVCSNGTLILMRLESGKWVLLDKIQPIVNSAPVLAHPALSHGKLVMRRERSVICFRLSE